jgi:hypothetical protein
MKEEKKELATINIKAPAQLIEMAIEKGNINLEQLEKLMRLQREHEADNARKAYNSRMVLVQKDIPSVAKTLKNNQTNSKYASLDEIIIQTKKIYTIHGFSICFYEGETAKPEHIRICADVVHEAGHKETYYYDVPLDGKGIKGNANMTAIHAKASSTSYAQRYLMCLIWNIPTGDDNDAQKIGVEYIDEIQTNTIIDLIQSKNVDTAKFCKAFGIEEVIKLPKIKYQQAYTALMERKVTPAPKATPAQKVSK